MSISKQKKLEKMPNLPSILFIGIPGPGLIGTLSLTYIVHSLKMEMVGEMEHSRMPSIVFIDEGNLVGPIRLFKRDSLFAVVSDVPVDYSFVEGFAESTVDFCKKNKVDMIVVLSGIHVQERNLSNLKTYGIVTDQRIEKVLYENEIPKFLSGMITGPDAALLTFLKNSPIPTMVLFTECNFFFPDPEAAIHTIKTVSHILKTEIDLTEFKKQIEFLRLQSRQLMQETLNVMTPEKAQPEIGSPQIYK